MKSITYGEVSIQRIVEIIAENVKKGHPGEYSVIIGTDSQNFDKTKIVLVIAVLQQSKGGFFFYDITKINKIKLWGYLWNIEI